MSKHKKETKKAISIKIEWIALGLLSVLLIISLLTTGFTNLPLNLKTPFAGGVFGTKEMDKEEIRAKALKFINEELLQGQTVAEITEIIEDPDSSLYKIILKIEEQEFDSYISKDGRYLYTERMEITSEEDEQTAEYPKQDTPDVLLFTMTYCPYGNQAEDFVKPVYDLLKNDIHFEPHYVIYNKDQGYEGEEYCLDSENKYCSMHGIGELNQGIRELCAFKYEPDSFWDFVMAANAECDASNIEECWTQAATIAGLNTDQIKTCQAEEALQLLEQDVELNQQHNVSGSPSIKINGQDYTGARNPEDFKQAVCAAFNNQPSACDQTLDESGSSSTDSCN